MKTHKHSLHRAKKMAGLGLIEIMISVALGIFLVGGVITIFTSNQQSFRVNENLAQIQESARFAYEQMNREIRDAGTNPCGVRAVNSVINRTNSTTIPWWGDWNAGTIRGYDGNESIPNSTITFGASGNNRVTGTDALVVMRTLSDEALLRTVALHDPVVDKKFVLNAPSTLKKQDLLFVCDGASGAIFELNTLSSSSGTSVVNYDTTSPSSNCSTALGWKNDVDCNTNSVVKTFPTGSIITKFDPAIWYVGISDTTGRRALIRESMHKRTSPSDSITTESREYVPDVHDMQITYLTRANPAGGGAAPSVLANDWVMASTINAQPNQWKTTNLNEAIAVRIELTFRSKETVGNDGNVNKAIERKSISVISLRNRELRP